MGNQLLNLKRNKCVICGRKIFEGEEFFCLNCEKMIEEEYLNEVNEDGI